MKFVIQCKEKDSVIEVPFCLDDVPDDGGIWVEYGFTGWSFGDDDWRRDRWFVQVDKLNPSESYLIDVKTVEEIYIDEHRYQDDIESVRLERIQFIFKDWSVANYI